MGLSIPGFVPGTLGEIYEYFPTFIEKAVTVGVWATGALVYTLLLKFAIPVIFLFLFAFIVSDVIKSP